MQPLKSASWNKGVDQNEKSASLSIHDQTTSLTHPMRFRRRSPTNRNHIPHSPIVPPQTAGIRTSTPLIRNLRLNTNLLRNDNPAVRLLLLAADGQNPLVAGPRGVVSDRQRVLRAPRVFLVFDPHVALQRVALRARFAASAEQGAEADGFGELAE